MRFPFLDGIRGYTALFVVIHLAAHEVPFDRIGGRVGSLLDHGLRGLLTHGRFAVAVFIVVSGVSLALPLTRRLDEARPTDWPKFFRRRAARILPAYFAALACTLLLIWSVPMLPKPTGERWDLALPALEWKTIVAHLLLVHNWVRSATFKICPAMWSIAVEWQIYFLFPLLVHIWKRFGLDWLVVCGFGMSVILNYRGLLGPSSDPWLLTLFVFGMVAAIDARSSDPLLRIGRSLDWSIGVFLLMFVPFYPGISIERMDFVFGAVAAWTCWLLLRQSGNGQESWMKKCCESGIAEFLGQISYSLYLVHTPIQAILNLTMISHGVSPLWRWIILMGPGTVLCVIVGWAFYHAFERWTHHRPEQVIAVAPG